MKLRLLLHLEELQMEHDIRHYDLESVPMTWDPVDQNPRLLTLEVRARILGGEGGLESASLRVECCSCPQGAQQGAESPKQVSEQADGEDLGFSLDVATTSCVALGKSLALSGPLLPYLKSTELA